MKNPIAIIPENPGHQHSDADVLVVCMRRLIKVFLPATTERGLRDAEECEDTAKLRYANGGITEEDILMSKVFQILSEMLEPVEDQKKVKPN